MEFAASYKPLKQVRFLLDPGDPCYPRLHEDLHILYCWCPWQGTTSSDDPSPHDCSCLSCCADWIEEAGAYWREYFVFNAAGIPIEKWRLVITTCSFGQCGGKHWELLWRAPSSNSVSEEFPRVLWGGWSVHNGNSVPTIFKVRVCKECEGWNFVCDLVKLIEKIWKWFEEM